MKKPLDLTGQTFGSLTVLGRSAAQVSRSEWNCRCVCGRDVRITTGNLRAKAGAICRCAQRDQARERRTQHGDTRCPEYRCWTDLKTRCTNSACASFADYGGRGITLDPRWHDYAAFLADMGRKPSSRHTIERVDVNGPYSPANCRWATVKEQANNKRNNRLLTYAGETLNTTQWAERIGLSADTLERRLNLLKWPVDKALMTPARGWGPGHPRR